MGDSSSKPPQGHSHEEYEIVWQNSIGALIEPATSLIDAMADGLEHAGLQLELIPRPGTRNYLNWIPGVKRTAKTDLEAEGETIAPGNSQFSELLEQRLKDFSVARGEALTAWAESKGLSPAQVENLKMHGELDTDNDPAEEGHVRRDRQQLYLLLYVQHMVRSNSPSFQVSCIEAN